MAGNRRTSRPGNTTANANRNQRSRPSAAAAKAPTKSNARSQSSPLAGRLAAYFEHHKTSAAEAYRRLLSVPGQTLPTCLVIAIALALPAFLYLGLVNFSGQTEVLQKPAQLSVFLHKQANPKAIEALKSELETNPQVESLRYISEAQALVEFESASGFHDVLASLEQNPLPAVFVITPADLTVEALEQMQIQLQQLTLVDSVQLDLQWVARLQQMAKIAEKILSALALLLALGVVLVVSNVIRLAIANRQDEIVIAKLVGASNGFVRRPFLYTGLWYGLFGGLLALAMLLIGQWWLAGPIARLAVLYQSNFELAGLSFGGSLALLLGAGGLGVAGAWVSVSRHLSAIRPR